MRAIVTGMIATYPVGGVFWDYAQYAIGLERLGWEVYYLEDTGCETFDPNSGLYGTDPSYGVSFLNRELELLSPKLAERWHFLGADGRSYGLSRDRFLEIAGNTDLFLNISGGTLLRDEYMKIPTKVLIDSDPGWNHFVNYPKWDRTPGWLGTHGYRAHDWFATYAELLGHQDCLLPSMNLSWIPTRPPVLLDSWQVRTSRDVWTTVMTWKNFRQPIEYRGKSYGTKELEFSKIEALPSRTAACLEVAVGGNDAPRSHWRNLGWSVVDSQSKSLTADKYRQYIETSRGEFSVAKNLYVATKSGWFSCRSVCYLAAGKPVVLQDTGFSEIIPSGRGLLAFQTLEEAADSIERVEADYDNHVAAAAELAREYFDSNVVLGDLLSRVGVD